MESRRIFRKLKSYVIYRFAATVQIVSVLTLLIYISNCPINSLFIILLALFNDLSMLPIAYDAQQASAVPENPNVNQMLLLSLLFGSLEVAFTMLWAYVSFQTNWFLSDLTITTCTNQSQAGVWLQMTLSAEFLIFAARAPSYIWLSIAPSPALFSSVMLACLVTSVLVGAVEYFGKLFITDILIIWAYCLICLVVIDFAKVMYLEFMNEFSAVLDDSELPKPGAESEEPAETPPSAKDTPQASIDADIEKGGPIISYTTSKDKAEDDSIKVTRADSAATRLELRRKQGPSSRSYDNPPEAKPPTPKLGSGGVTNVEAPRTASSSNVAAARTSSSSAINIDAFRRPSSAAIVAAQRSSSSTQLRAVASPSGAVYAANATGGDSGGRLSGVSSSRSLRPFTPANKTLKK